MECAIDVVFDRPGLASSREALAVYTENLLSRCLLQKKLEGAGVTVLFCSSAAMRRLNHDHLGKDAPTDVLSFPALENPRRLKKGSGVYLGDIAVCLPYCARQAKAGRRPLADEVTLMLVHGLLHLLGRDHDTPAREKAMWTETDRLIAETQGLKRPRISVG